MRIQDFFSMQTSQPRGLCEYVRAVRLDWFGWIYLAGFIWLDLFGWDDLAGMIWLD